MDPAHMGMVHKGADPTNYRLYSAYFDGTQWYGDRRIEDQPGAISPQSTHNPGICLYNNRLYLVYKGVDVSELFMAWYDGFKWFGNQEISSTPGGASLRAAGSPCLVQFQDRMWVFYKDAGSTDILGAAFDGNTWSEAGRLASGNALTWPRTSEGPHAAVYDGRLALAYKEPDSTYLYITWFDGENWYPSERIKDLPGETAPRSDHNPGMLVYLNRLYLVYRASGSSNLFVAWYNGSSWNGDTSVGMPGGIQPKSEYSPGMLLFNNRMYLVYKGFGLSDLYSAWYDGRTWGGDVAINKQPGGIRPQCNYCPDLAFFPVSAPDNVTWLAGVDGSLPISEINLPGTHDSAAINTSLTTPYACHYASITSQLRSGVRLLDIRLKVKASGTNYTFVTCHGTTGSYAGLNEYQSFQSVLDECRSFLQTADMEFVAMSLKVDDWAGYTDTQAILAALGNLLSVYPVYSSSTMPSLAKVRGRIYLLNRINEDPALGVPIGIPDNTRGDWLASDPNRNFDVYVQDRYKGLPSDDTDREKLRLFTEALDQKRNGQLLLNFASATYYGVRGVYIMSLLLDWFGNWTADERPKNLGWSFFDYEATSYQTDKYGFLNCVQFIVWSNFAYGGCEDRFSVVGDGKDG